MIIARSILVACLAGAVGCSTEPSVVDEDESPAEMEVVSGNDQVAEQGTLLPDPVVVRVLDSAGAPVPGTVVQFEVVEGNGTVAGGTRTTNTSGVAEEQWTLGPDTGSVHRLVARVSSTDPDITTSFTARATPMPLPPPPPPPPPPGGGTLIFSEGFEAGSLAVWDDRSNPDRHRVVESSSLAHTGSHVLEFSYDQGSDGGGFLTKFFMPGYDSLLVTFWNRYSADWESGGYLVGIFGSRTDDQWTAFGKAAVCPNGSDFFNVWLYADYPANPGPVRFYTYHTDMQTSDCYGDTGGGRAVYSGDRTLDPGVWHRVDIWVRLNAPGQSNGVQRFWVNGLLVGEWTGLNFRNSDILRLNSVMITAYQSFGVPQDQLRYVDDIAVYANAPSPAATAGGP